MNASLLWLRDFLDRDVTAQRVRTILTERAATVENVVQVREDLSEIVVARVVEAQRHPDAEKLWLTKVDTGSGDLLQVVCGAPNVKAGTAYPFAPVGATLPGGFKIEKRKIRGQVSNGMLCSARELGLGTDHTGILALETAAAPGTPFLSATDVGDVRFEIDVLPNRPDLLSHEGLAREIAAALGAKLLSWTPPANRSGNGSERIAIPAPRRVAREGTTDDVRVIVEDSRGCPRYMGVVIRGVTIGPSPRWLARRLEGAGVRSINNVVDATNFMLHGFGQPMHAFDLGRLGGEVSVRAAHPGERLVTLDGVERKLEPSMTVIAAAGGAEAIAGVIGGEGSEVTEATTDIFLEVAIFDSRRVRAARRALGVSTDASYRFERHVDFERLPLRAALATELITLVAGGRVDDAPVDVGSGDRKRSSSALRTQRVAAVLGEPVSEAGIIGLLSPVGFEVQRRKDTLDVTAPSWRGDISDEIDLIEEVARLRGYDSFSSELRPFRPTSVPDDPMVAVERRVRAALVACGLLETRPMPFVSAASDERLRVRNPLAENEAYLRESILTSLVGRAEHNLAHMVRSVRLFEIGTVFRPGEGPRPAERTHAGVLVMGHADPPHFTNATPRQFDGWDVKWIAEVIVQAAFQASELKFTLSRASEPLRGPIARTLWIVEVAGSAIGGISLLALDAPAWASPAFGLELDLNGAALVGAEPPRYRSLPSTPAAELDLALLVPDSVSAESVEGAIRRHGGDILESAMLFDEFRGPGIVPGMRSLAWRLTFRHPDRTLRDREVESRREKLISVLASELGVQPRAL